jgi:hypothetical protein
VATAFLELDNLATYFPVETGFIFKRTLGNVRAVSEGDAKIKRRSRTYLAKRSEIAFHLARARVA